MSVRTYNPSVRVGNWNEDVCLEEDLLKDFLEKKERGELLVQKTHNLLRTILKPLELSQPADGLLHIGDHVSLLHIPSKSVVSAYMSAAQAHEARQLESGSLVSCSKRVQPCMRNVFVIGSADPAVSSGDVVHYDQHITFTTLPNEGGQLSLHSDDFSFMKHSKYSREQEVTLVGGKLTYKCAWRIQCFNQRMRLELEGQPVPVNQPLFINHCKTNQHLAVHTEYCPSTPFGREYEVTGSTKFNIHRAEDTQNHFMILTGDPDTILSTLVHVC